MSQMTPREIVQELDRHIIGQSDAKRAVAIALRNRWRRMQVDEDLRVEITPKNILMIGPTGVGKTEIARRLAQLANAPFIKVEATKFTEVGYVGKDVESIIRDLVDTSVKMTREQAMARVRSRAEDAAYDRVVDCLLPRPQSTPGIGFANEPAPEPTGDDATRQKLRYRVVHGEMDDKEIEFDVSAQKGVDIMTPPGMEEMASQLQGLFQNMGSGRKQKRRMKIRDALPILIEEEEGEIQLGRVEHQAAGAIQFAYQNLAYRGRPASQVIPQANRREDAAGAVAQRQGAVVVARLRLGPVGHRLDDLDIVAQRRQRDREAGPGQAAADDSDITGLGRAAHEAISCSISSTVLQMISSVTFPNTRIPVGSAVINF